MARENKSPIDQARRCELWLQGDANVEGDPDENVAQKKKQLEQFIREKTGYLEENIHVWRSDAPASGTDYSFAFKPGTGEFLHSMNRSANKIRNSEPPTGWAKVEGVVPDCTTLREMKRVSTSGPLGR